VENLSTELVKRGHAVTVLTSMLPNMDLPSTEITPTGVEIIRIKIIFPLGKLYASLSSQGFALTARKKIEQIVKEKQIDVIHVHGHHYYLTWQAIATANRLRVPSVLTMHGLYALNPYDPIAHAEEEIFNYTIFKRELSRVKATIGLTPIITNYAKKYGPLSGEYVTIANGVNHQLFIENSKNRSYYRKKYNISENSIVVLFRGRFSSIKGVLELAEAARLVVKENKHAYFLFVGGGTLITELEKALLPIRENSRILSWTPLSEIHELYLASDVFVLPSKSEALPLTILEAMAASLFIISTPVGGIPDVLKTYPYKEFIKKSDSIEIFSKLLQLTLEKEKIPTFANCFSPVDLEAFCWKNIASKVEAVYFNAVSKNGLIINFC
jgi:glycosyltransferase involved in cell wall biosynthesis